eukprot:scaffold30193_cov47-Attheya_sp.AAC.1
MDGTSNGQRRGLPSCASSLRSLPRATHHRGRMGHLLFTSCERVVGRRVLVVVVGIIHWSPSHSDTSSSSLSLSFVVVVVGRCRRVATAVVVVVVVVLACGRQ